MAESKRSEARVEKIRELAQPIIDELGLYLYDLSLSMGRRPQLRIKAERVDKNERAGVTVGELTRLSRTLDRLIELENVLGFDYAIEVSSPGLERELKTVDHFAAAVGETVKIVTTSPIEGQTEFCGQLKAYVEDGLVIAQPENPLRIALADVRRARTVFQT